MPSQWLLLTIKSITPSHTSKHYQVVIENHQISNKITISNLFENKYQYVYKLWPCKPSQRELLKICMHQIWQEEGKQQKKIKKGEATAIVNYSQQGQTFQFYTKEEKEGNSVLILMFWVQEQQKFEQEASRVKINNINNQLEEASKSHKYEAQKQAKYLEYTTKYINDLSQQEFSKKNVNLPQKQKEQTKKSSTGMHFSIGLQKGSSSEYGNNGSIYKATLVNQNKNNSGFLNNAKYLNIDHKINNERYSTHYNEIPREQVRSRTGKVRAKTQMKDNYDKNMLSLDISKRRQLYMCSRSISLPQSQQQSLTPAQISAEKTQTDQEHNEQLSQAQVAVQTDQLQYQNTKPTQTSPIITPAPTINIQSSSSSIQKQQVPLLDTQQEQLPMAHRTDNIQITPIVRYNSSSTSRNHIIRISQYPSEHSYLLNNSRHLPTIRSRNKSRIQQQQSQSEGPPRSITHISRRSHLYNHTPTEHYSSFDIELYHFKTQVYKSHGRCFKWLVLIFEDSRYSTVKVQCLHLSTLWKEKFCIKKCQENCYLYCRLYFSYGEENVEEGEVCINIGELPEIQQNVQKIELKKQDDIIGHLQFTYNKKQCPNKPSLQQYTQNYRPNLNKQHQQPQVHHHCQQQQQESNLHQQTLPQGLQQLKPPHQRKLTLKEYPSSLRPKDHQKQSKSLPKRRLQLLPVYEKEVRIPAEKSGNRYLKTQNSALSKIREKKIKMRAKLK